MTKRDLYIQVISFMKLFSLAIVFLAGLAIGMWFFVTSFSDKHAMVFLYFYLVSFSLYFVYNKHKSYFSKENLRNLMNGATTISKSLVVFLVYLSLFAVGVVFMFLIGSWIAGLSAISVIIILLFLILIKK